jgi:hypothetical protein
MARFENLHVTKLTVDQVAPKTVGSVPSGVSVKEYGDEYGNRTTVLTVNKVDAFTVADNSALCDGTLLYTFPAGAIIVDSAKIALAVSLAEDTTATPEIGLGNVEGSDTQATLGADDAGCENILGPATMDDCDGTVETLTATTNSGAGLVLAAADAHTVYCNIAATWADTAGTDLTGDLAGTVVLNWKFMG